MAVKIGFEGKVHRNTATFASPTWVVVGIVKEPTLTIEKDEVEIKNRGLTWSQFKGAMKKGSVELSVSHDPADTHYIALRDAFLNETLVDLAISDGPIATAGTNSFRAEMAVLSMSRAEPIDGEMVTTFSVKPGVSSNNPTLAATP